jgi:hypothetical protein
MNRLLHYLETLPRSSPARDIPYCCLQMFWPHRYWVLCPLYMLISAYFAVELVSWSSSNFVTNFSSQLTTLAIVHKGRQRCVLQAQSQSRSPAILELLGRSALLKTWGVCWTITYGKFHTPLWRHQLAGSVRVHLIGIDIL